MPDDKAPPDDVPEEKVAVVTNELPELSSNPPVAASEARQLALVDPDILVLGLRLLQRRIPGFVQLSVEEEQSLTRAASLDPEFVDAGIYAGKAWDDTKQFVGRSGDDLRQEAEEIRRWDEVEKEFRAVTKGIANANRQRRHHLGMAILDIYSFLGRAIRKRTHLRPHYEEMKRAYRRSSKSTRKKKKPGTEEE